VGVEALQAGRIVAIPTETFYALAVDSSDPVAVGRLNDLKRKPPDSPALVLLADVEQAARVARELPPSFHRLAAAFWPGPLTLVVRGAEGLPEAVCGARGTVGIRMPGLALPRALAAELGHPVTGVSANLHGEPACRTAAEVLLALPEGIAVILDGGPTPGGVSSTVLDLSGPVPRLIRAGAVPLSAVRPFLPDVGAP
jgi:tRNA threonylcarbamoyl adenosine modification protein (Sua5/YciO/YrdC/YwlC family)